LSDVLQPLQLISAQSITFIPHPKHQKWEGSREGAANFKLGNCSPLGPSAIMLYKEFMHLFMVMPAMGTEMITNKTDSK
jgi:hypothetical protein